MSNSSRRLFLDSVEAAYTACAVHLQMRLPIDNPLLQCLSALDPIARGNAVTCQNLGKLPKLVTNVLTEEEEEKFELEIRLFQVSTDLPSPHDQDMNPVRLDTWWAAVSKTGLFPCLCRMAFALMSCFHGPTVEGSFNTMGDILDPKSSRMNIETYSAIQTVKYGLRASGQRAVPLFKRKDVLNGPVHLKVCRNIKTARKRYAEEQGRKKNELEAKRQKLSMTAQKLQSKKKAKEALCKAEKADRLAHKRKMKARLEELVAKKARKN